MNFNQAFDELLRHEGGFSDHAADPGGKTRYGITEVVARAHGYRGDMRELPLDAARLIYRAAYWDAVRADELPAGVRYAVFDAAVNSGVRQAVRWLQRALDVSDDGVLGPRTMASAQAQDPEALLRRMLAQRLNFMTSLSTWPSFGRGWARRIAALMEMQP
jgi:lysozyme family protein